MTVFVAGGTGTIGVLLVRALAAGGHRVVASTRTPDKQALVRELGATPAVVDALDAAALERAVCAAAPTHVVHQLTALPATGVRRAGDLAATNRLREEGTRNLLNAAIAAGAQRIVAGSFAMLGAVDRADDERDPAVLAVRSMESRIQDAVRRGVIEGVVLRYGLFYGPSSPATLQHLALVGRRRLPRVRGDGGLLPFIYLDDAVSATVAALERGVSGGVYDIVDDQPASFSDVVSEMARLTSAPRPLTVPGWLLRLTAPYLARLLTRKLQLSNTAARRELGWAPRYRSYREGLSETIDRLAGARVSR